MRLVELKILPVADKNKKREYLKDKINELLKNSKKKISRYLHRGINVFKKGYQPRTNLVKMRIVICFQIPTVFGQMEE
jgi:hypothetical protein